MDEITLSLRLIAATVLSGTIGLNRELGGHTAGLRTHMLVGLGSALFTIISIVGFSGPGSSPDRVAAQIVTGIGFLGAGAIVRRSDQTSQGLTTAAGIWAVAAIGMAAGAGMVILAGVGTGLILIVLTLVGYLERHGLNPIIERGEHRKKPNQTPDGAQD